MKKKDYVILATDNATRAIQILMRIAYENPKQAKRNMNEASELFASCVDLLEFGKKAEEKEETK